MASYADGVTINVNGTPATITAAEQQADHAVIRYTLATPVQAGDTVTFSYDKSAGGIVAETGGAALADVTAQTVTNNVALALPKVASATLLLDLRASQLTLNDGDPVSTWADASGNGCDFTQTGDARPTYHTGSGTPYVEFDGIDDILIGQNWTVLDNPEGLLIVTVAKYVTVNPTALYGILISKQYATTGPFQYPGWDIGCYIAARGPGLGKEPPDFLFVTDGSNFFDRVGDLISYPDDYHITTYEALDRNTLDIYVDGEPVGGDVDDLDWKVGTITTTSNTEPVRIGNNGAPDLSGWFSGYLRSLLIYSPAPSVEDRAAIETWLAMDP